MAMVATGILPGWDFGWESGKPWLWGGAILSLHIEIYSWAVGFI